jgi:TPR repeat protein
MKKAIAAAVLTMAVFVEPIASAAPINDAQTAYDNGDYATAFKLYKPLAEQGNARARRMLASLYGFGGGTHMSVSESIKWYRSAAELKDNISMSNLGYFYRESYLGLPQNYVRAHMWFNLALANSNNVQDRISNSTSLVGLQRKMTPAQIAEAQEMARKCQASNFKQCD